MNNSTHEPSETLYVDTGLGKKGGAVWVAVFGWFVMVYAIYILYNGAMNMVFRGDTGVAALFFVCLLYVVFLLITATLVIFQALKTLQRVKCNFETGSCVGWFYFGRSIQFNKNEVAGITPFTLKVFKYFKIPLGRGCGNSKVHLTRGEIFCVSNAMPGATEFISWLNSKEGEGSRDEGSRLES